MPTSSEPAHDDDVSGLGYAAATAELEDILEELEDDEIDVDVLARRVRRAAALIRLCRERIADARVEVESIVAELDDTLSVDQATVEETELEPGAEDDT